MTYYVKKPIPVAAVKVEKENRDEIIELLKSGSTNWEELNDGFMVHSWEGVEPVKYGSNYWIIRGIKGECYPCEGSVFEESYTKYKKKYKAYLTGFDTCEYNEAKKVIEVDSKEEAEQWCQEHSSMGGYDWYVDNLFENKD